MIVDLNPMPYQTAIEIMHWCYNNKVDDAKALVLIDALAAPPSIRNIPDDEWTLDIPDEYISWLILLFS